MAKEKKTILQMMKENSRGQAGTMSREFVKDIQQTFHDVMYGKPMHPSEPGTPLNPTPQLVTEALTGEKVNRQTDRLESPKQETTLDQMRGNQPKQAQPNKQQERGGIDM